jgi:hypothetical protein
MEHIPLPADPAQAHLKVPLLCEDNMYDGSGIPDWLEYGTKWGYAVHTYDDSPILVPINPKGSQDAFIQSWLWFGVLTEFCRVILTFDLADSFIETEGSQKFLTTKSLEQKLTLSRTILSLFPQRIRELQYTTAKHLLTHAENFCYQCLSRTGQRRHQVSVSPEISTSVLVLIETLKHATRVLWVESVTDLAHTPPNQWTYDRMKENGWCESDVHCLHTLAGSSACYYATLLKPNDVLDHSNCSPKACKHRIIVESTYATKHTSPQHEALGPNCTYMQSDLKEVIALLANTRIPRFIIPKVRNKVVLEDSLKVTGNGKYVAISHVWSDGMGNPHSNTLPKCQVQRIMDYANDLTQSHGSETAHEQWSVWIDTLCIPLAREARNDSINLLSRTFREANMVLVISNEFTNIDSAMVYEELLTRIVLSNWCRRLWTLEEGILAGENLYLQFRDKAVPLFEYIMRAQETQDPWQGVKMDIWKAVDNVFPIIRQPMATDKKVVTDSTQTHQNIREVNLLPGEITLATALRFRTSTKPADEALCLASLLSLDVRRILQEEPKERMKHLYDNLKVCSPKMIFTLGPKLHSEGYTWAPASFMNSAEGLNGAIVTSRPELAKMGLMPMAKIRGLKGLEFKWPACLLDLGGSPLQECFTFVVGAKKHTCEPKKHDGIMSFTDHPALDLDWWRRLQNTSIKPGFSLAILFSKLDGDEGEGTNDAALVQVLNVGWRATTAMYLGPLKILKEEERTVNGTVAQAKPVSRLWRVQ